MEKYMTVSNIDDIPGNVWTNFQKLFSDKIDISKTWGLQKAARST